MPILWGYLINWLDHMARYLEAIEAVAGVLGKGEAAKEAGERNRLGHQWRRLLEPKGIICSGSSD